MTDGPQAPRYAPIEDYGLIGDRVSAALVSKAGSIDWLCLPRMDSPSVFAKILDAERGGSCSLAPTADFSVTRRYSGDTAILETEFATATGRVRVTDFMPIRSRELHGLGDGSIIRLVEGIEGQVEMELRFDPVFDYARAEPEWVIKEGMGARARWDDETLTIYASRMRLQRHTRGITARQTVRAGDECPVVIAFRKPASMMFTPGLRDMARPALDETRKYWNNWVSACRYEGPYADAVRRSAIVLRLLDYGPTGALVAAPTTSLPETPGGERNWDYRYCWIRDAAFTMYCFLQLGYPEEAEVYLHWLLDVTRGAPKDLQVLYGLDGGRETPEVVLGHLEGYGGARPVRIGNAAVSQRQLDMYGEILDCAYLMHRAGGVLSDDLWEWLCRVVDHACDVWQEPDRGPWEIRAAPRHFVYSKLLCWVAVDRGIRLARQRGDNRDRGRWIQVRDDIRDAIEWRGYNPSLEAFTAAFDGDDLDASVLALPLRRFIRADDPRMVSTVGLLQERLARPGYPFLIERVSPEFEDGLSGEEGAFLICSFWLVDNLTMRGELDAAEAMLNQLLEHANDLGLFAEMADPATGHQLGNFPQAFTHIALVNAAVHLQYARSGRREDLAGINGE